MRQLVTLNLAKLHIRKIAYDLNNQPITDDLEDEIINLYIDSASEWIQNYLPHTYEEGEEIPATVKTACLLLIGESYLRREAAVVGTFYTDTKAVENVLQALRKITVY